MLRVMENFHDNITITLFFTNFRANVMNNLMIHAALQSTSLTDLSISVSYKSLKHRKETHKETTEAKLR